ncbi:MAG: hypothetical protein ACLPZR_10665 [Solirubrobacteraceae bacterium]
MIYADNKRRVLAGVALAVVLLVLGFLLGAAAHSSSAPVPSIPPSRLTAATHAAAHAQAAAAAAQAHAATLGRQSRHLTSQLRGARRCLAPHRSHVRLCLGHALRSAP